MVTSEKRKTVEPNKHIKMTEFHIQKAIEHCHNFLLDAEPQTREAKANTEEIVDLKTGLKKLLDRYESTMNEIYGGE